MAVPPAFDLQGLLSEDQWIRRLARRLAGDGHAAEDLVQDTWAAALDAPRPRPRSLRPWLRGILRNVWIDRRRADDARGARERAASRDEALSSTGELVAELELRKCVAEALLELEEPYRRALYLRFFKDQSLKAIAAREGIALSSVHERIQQGLARLRARLDRAHGERRAWAVGLLALAAPARGSWLAAAETVAMAGALKVAAPILAVGAGVAWWWIERAEPERAAPAEAAAASPGTDRPAETMELARAGVPGSVRTELPPPSGPLSPPAGASEESLRIHGRVIDEHGLPVANVAVGWSGAPAEAPHARSAADGTFELERATRTEEAQVHDLEPDLVTLVPGATAQMGRPESWIVVVAPRAEFGGLVLDPDGAPVAGAKVVFGLREVLFRELGLHRSFFGRPERETMTDESGAFLLAEIAGGERVLLQVEAEGFWIAMADLPETSTTDLVIRLERDAEGRTITGIVLAPGGAAVAGARISAGDAIVTTSDDGRFELTVGQRAGTFAPLDAEHEALRQQEDREAHLVALKAGFAPARERLADLDLTAPVVLHLGAKALAVRGRVLDPAGAARSGIVVWACDPTPFGREIQSMAEGTTVAWQQTIEDELAGGFGARGATTDEHGEFELRGLLARAYELRAFDPRTAEVGGPWTIGAPSEGVELVMPGAARRGRVAGRIVSLGGKPLAGVAVSPRHESKAGGSAHSQPPWTSHQDVKTDAEGRFEFAELALDGTELLLQDPRFLIRTVALAGFDDLERLELVEPLLCELQVDLTGDPDFADSVRVLDDDGRELETTETFDNGWSMGTEAQFRDGLTSVLSVRETAATLVLRKDGLEVLRRPLRLDPDRRTTVRP